MTTCQVCGDSIHQRPNVAYRDDDPRCYEGQPWLHLHGMDYEERGVLSHPATPAPEHSPCFDDPDDERRHLQGIDARGVCGLCGETDGQPRCDADTGRLA